MSTRATPSETLRKTLRARGGRRCCTASAIVTADVPDQSSGRFGGIYKVTSSNDPLFPATKTREYFLDFGRGIQANKLSGSVAVSMRRNPNVKVRIMRGSISRIRAKS